ncbi:MAG: type II toxin-antitoxin system prevent-host-death family antitoxin [Gammaproteobacteria bacterium]|nr:type II toxin-antitoxin system prevent-host-death family antitoxin [Gammaproteobacteria bacterium]
MALFIFQPAAARARVVASGCAQYTFPHWFNPITNSIYPACLIKVEKGAKITITRHGAPVAQLAPAEKEEKPAVKKLTQRSVIRVLF